MGASVGRWEGRAELTARLVQASLTTLLTTASWKVETFCEAEMPSQMSPGEWRGGGSRKTGTQRGRDYTA